jgi:fructosamine-3-kinase
VSLDAAARTRIAAALGASVATVSRLSGGQIAEVWRADLTDGRSVVIKHGAGLALEARMLRHLVAETDLPVPAVQLADDDLLVMDGVIHDGRLSPGAEIHLADLVARLHAHEGPAFGFAYDTLIGGLPQPNPHTADWREFFRDQRLLAMGRAAAAAGRLPPSVLSRLETLCDKLHIWVRNDAEPALIHGDLWNGNILSAGARVVGVIDPALYFADPEIELAFMTLFNTVGARFFARYAERRPMRPGFFEERRDLYNLYPLLVHVRLFGGAYLAQVERTLVRYGC